MCRSDVQLIDGYFQQALSLKFPITPGHEIAGLVEVIGDRVPDTAKFAVGRSSGCFRWLGRRNTPTLPWLRQPWWPSAKPELFSQGLNYLAKERT